MEANGSLFKDSVKSLGIVFGDIGTSPLYALGAAFSMGLATTMDNIMGICSLFVWTLILLVTVQYAWLAMSLASKENGEGGIIVLKEILAPLLRSPKAVFLATALAFVGISFFIGDGVITPAVSILSAVEGLKLIPSLHGLTQKTVIIVALLITAALFAFQKRGTERVSLAFGPIMAVWFSFLALLGLVFLVVHPELFKAINPYYAIKFLSSHGLIGILMLSKVILCATGGEALYADMGHLGRKPITWAWGFVFCALVLTYLGQGAFLLEYPHAHDVFYEMVLVHFKFLYIPILILSIMATVIASQALISGLFSIVYQGITTHILPRLHVEYTSSRFMAQIYIPFVNRLLFVFVVLAILKFQEVKNLTSAYGLAVSGTMAITAILLSWIFILRKNVAKAVVACLLVPINLLFFFVNMYKIPYGGYWSIIISCIPLGFIVLYSMGRKKLNRLLRQMPMALFIEKFSLLAHKMPHITGTAVFLCKTIESVPKYVVQTMFVNTIMYEENVIVAVTTLTTPFGVSAMFKEDLAPGLRFFEIKIGYLEITNIEKLLNSAHIHPKVIFYGVEDLATKNPFWRMFSVIKKLTPSFVQFYKLPRHKLHGVIIRVDI